MFRASGSADARSPPLRPAEASITVAIEQAHMVIPSACVVLPAGQPATTPRSPEIRPHAAPREGRSWRGRPVRMARTLRRTTPKSPVRVAGGRARLLPADWAPGGHQRPEELPRPSRVSLERVSSYDPKGRLNLTVATAGGAPPPP